MNREHCLALAAQPFDDGRLFELLARRVARRTEGDGASTQTPEAVAQALEDYLVDELGPALAALGFDCERIANPVAGAGPLLIARRIEDPAAPTVLTYGHGDVVNGQDGRWHSGRSPWVLADEGEHWYGRGSADNKGQHTINQLALAAAIQARGGRLGYNVTALFEMGEEAGSPGLAACIAGHREQLAADLFLASDGPRVSASRPTLFMGSRGAVNFSLRLRARERAHHSGNWGGVLVNPAVRIAHAVACLVDAQGRILVPGLLPPPIDAATRLALAEVPVGGGADDPAIDAGWGEPGLSPAEQLFGWNTLEVLALGAGSPQRPINAVPAEAVAHCQLRFVVGTRWEDLAETVRAHLQAHGFEDVQVELQSAGAATRLKVDHPWVLWAAASMARSLGQPPVRLPNLAGTLPNALFAQGLGLPTLWVPHSYPACAQHAPDEHLLPAVAREGLQAMAGLFWDLGEPDAPWSAGRGAAAA